MKAGQHVVDGVSNPVELGAALNSEEPDISKISDKKIRRAVEKAIKGTAIHPIFETVVHRSTRKIKAKGGDIELAVDMVLADAHAVALIKCGAVTATSRLCDERGCRGSAEEARRTWIVSHGSSSTEEVTLHSRFEKARVVETSPASHFRLIPPALQSVSGVHRRTGSRLSFMPTTSTYCIARPRYQSWLPWMVLRAAAGHFIAAMAP